MSEKKIILTRKFGRKTKKRIESEMAKIEIRENKILKLSNVLSRKVPSKELFSQDKQIVMLQNYIKAKGLETVGPLVIYSSGIKGVDAENNPIIDNRILMQLKNGNHKPEVGYRGEKEIRIENCLMARFNDESEKLQFATMKLSLFAYENDIELTGETYIVMIDQEDKIMIADVFMPIKNSENNNLQEN